MQSIQAPENLLAEINGHQLYRETGGSVSIWTPGSGWWAVCIEEGRARRLVEGLAAPREVI